MQDKEQFDIEQTLKTQIQESKSWDLIQEHRIFQDDESSMITLLFKQIIETEPAKPWETWEPNSDSEFHKQKDHSWKRYDGSYIIFKETDYYLYITIFDSGQYE